MLTEEAIVEQIQADQEMMTVLAIIRDLNLADAWLAAGAGLTRQQIWIWSFMTLRLAMRRLSRSSRN